MVQRKTSVGTLFGPPLFWTNVHWLDATSIAVIIGAAGMDYHVFNRVYRDNPLFDVKAFTMAVEQNLGTGM